MTFQAASTTVRRSTRLLSPIPCCHGPDHRASHGDTMASSACACHPFGALNDAQVHQHFFLWGHEPGGHGMPGFPVRPRAVAEWLTTDTLPCLNPPQLEVLKSLREGQGAWLSRPAHSNGARRSHDMSGLVLATMAGLGQQRPTRVRARQLYEEFYCPCSCLSLIHGPEEPSALPGLLTMKELYRRSCAELELQRPSCACSAPPENQASTYLSMVFPNSKIGSTGAVCVGTLRCKGELHLPLVHLLSKTRSPPYRGCREGGR